MTLLLRKMQSKEKKNSTTRLKGNTSMQQKNIKLIKEKKEKKRCGSIFVTPKDFARAETYPGTNACSSEGSKNHASH